MGKVKGVFVGKICGSVGKVTFRCRNGENVVSQKIVQQKNPRTEVQQIQRMKMNTVVSAYSVLSKFCDHSFQNCSGKKENFSRFVKLNVERLHLNDKPSTPVLYNFKPKGYDSKFIPNEYIISEGDLRVKVTLIWDALFTKACLSIDKKTRASISSDVTVAEFHKIFGVEIGTQFSLVTNDYWDGNSACFSRYIWRNESKDEKVFNSDGTINESLLSEESQIDNRAVFEYSTEMDSSAVTISKGDYGTAAGMIISVRKYGKWVYSNSVMAVDDSLSGDYLSENALPTYGIGSNKYLNNATV